MKIEIIGSGCLTCELLYKKVKMLAPNEKVEYINDVNELVKRGLMGSPALVIDGKVMCVGMPSDGKLKELLGNWHGDLIALSMAGQRSMSTSPSMFCFAW